MSLTAGLRWGAATMGVLGAILVALHIPLSGWGYILFLCSSTLWIAASYRMGDRAILMETSVYTLINLLGIWRWLF